MILWFFFKLSMFFQHFRTREHFFNLIFSTFSPSFNMFQRFQPHLSTFFNIFNLCMRNFFSTQFNTFSKMILNHWFKINDLIWFNFFFGKWFDLIWLFLKKMIWFDLILFFQKWSNDFKSNHWFNGGPAYFKGAVRFEQASIDHQEPWT